MEVNVGLEGASVGVVQGAIQVRGACKCRAVKVYMAVRGAIKCRAVKVYMAVRGACKCWFRLALCLQREEKRI